MRGQDRHPSRSRSSASASADRRDVPIPPLSIPQQLTVESSPPQVSTRPGWTGCPPLSSTLSSTSGCDAKGSLSIRLEDCDLDVFYVDRHENWVMNTELPIKSWEGTPRSTPLPFDGPRLPRAWPPQQEEEDSGPLCALHECHVHLRNSSLGRFDEIPDNVTGRRNKVARDRSMRVFIVLPGSGRLALWVEPHWRIGPVDHGTRNRFTDIWGHDADQAGPFSGRQGLVSKTIDASNGQRHRIDSHLKQLLAERQTSTDGGNSDHFATVAVTPIQTVETPNLKSLVEAATGIPVARQKLVMRKRGLLDNSKCLRDCDVWHGVTLHLIIKSCASSAKEGRCLTGPALVKAKKNSKTPFLLNRIVEFSRGSGATRERVVPMPDWHPYQTAKGYMFEAVGAEHLEARPWNPAQFDSVQVSTRLEPTTLNL